MDGADAEEVEGRVVGGEEDGEGVLGIDWYIWNQRRESAGFVSEKEEEEEAVHTSWPGWFC